MKRVLCSVIAALGLLGGAVAMPMAGAAPVLSSDSQGYIDSTARCTAPDKAVAFGQTSASRIAICVTPQGAYQYRGVRTRDGAKLITDAKQSGDGFVIDNDGISYLVTEKSLVVSADSDAKVIREETMLDYHRPQASAAAPTTTTTTKPLPPPMAAEVGGN